MARTSDHDARRRQVVAGVQKMALSDGIGRVTMAGAAAAAEVSVGLVQHYYASKEDLLVETLVTVRTGVLDRVEAEVAKAELRHERIEHMMRAGFAEMLPLDARRREEVYLVQAFTGLALDNDRLREALHASDEVLHRRVATAIDNGKRCGEVLADTDADAVAYGALAFNQGLASRLLVRGGRAELRWANEALRERMAALFPGPCSREESD